MTPILRRRKGRGRFIVEQIDGYLGEYETLDDLYQNALIAFSMMYKEFSYGLELDFIQPRGIAHRVS